MELEKQITNNSINLEKEQNKFINTTVGKVVDTALDIGIRYIMPDLIEEEVIDVKNALLENGLNAGIQTAVDNVVNIAKTAKGIVTGNFESVSQIKKAVETGGMIDTISESIDFAARKANQAGIINSTVRSLITTGKNAILNNITTNIEAELTNQEKSIEKIEKYTNKWKEYYQNKDFEGMEKEYKKIKEKMEEIMPIEKTIKNARTIETIHNLIKNNGKNFNLTHEEIDLSTKLN